MLTHDHRLALVDMGMVLRIEPHTRDDLLRLLLAAAEGRAREAADVAVELGVPLDGFDEDAFRRDVAELIGYFVDSRAEDVAVGRIVLEIARISGRSGLRPPRELVLLGRTLSNLDAVGRILDPRFDARRALSRHAESIMTESMMHSLSPHALMRTMVETKELAEQAPRRLNAILGNLAENKVTFNVAATDAATWRETISRAASRLTLGIVLAALIVGAALLMRVQTGPELFGYPAVAIVFFMIAGLGGLLLVAQIVLESFRSRSSSRSRS